MAAESLVHPDTEGVGFNAGVSSDRRADIEAKHGGNRRAAARHGPGRTALWSLENFSWLTSGGATARGRFSIPMMAPAVYCNGEGRWLTCATTSIQPAPL